MDMSLNELRELVMDREAWRAAVLGVTKSRTRLSNWTELSPNSVFDSPPSHPDEQAGTLFLASPNILFQVGLFHLKTSPPFGIPSVFSANPSGNQ